jgi:four helix bundle protein
MTDPDGGDDVKHAESFRDLVVYQKARGVARGFFEISKTFPQEERYSLTDQERRSSRSVGAQIAEAWAKRRYEKHFASKLTDADGEQQETQHWVETAFDCGYLTEQKRAELVEEPQRIGRMLQSMMDKTELFCGAPASCVREDSAEYFVNR